MNFLKLVGRKFRGLKSWQKILTVILILLLFGVISDLSSTEVSSSGKPNNQNESSEPNEESTIGRLNNSSVNWANYAPAVKQGIADLIDAQDCQGLQSEFDIADSNNDAQRNRTGASNADLMSLIDDEMRNIGCY